MFERKLIEQIRALGQHEHPLLVKGIGDDCAIFDPPAGHELLLTADMLVEGVHFDTSWHSPELLGEKALAVNLSDIAGMGGVPLFILLSIGVSSNQSTSWTERLLKGFIRSCTRYNCQLIGGDTVNAARLTLSVTAIGSAPKNCSIQRGTAKVGDRVYVSGNLGSAAAGLYLYQNRQAHIDHRTENRWAPLLMRHLSPVPRLELGRKLRERGVASAMQDLSDGLATDLSHICTASEVAAVIHENSLPADSALNQLCRKESLDLTDLQLRGGDDYELVFTISEKDEPHLHQIIEQLDDPVSVHHVGEIQKGRGVSLLTTTGELQNIEYQGFEHVTP